MKRLSLRQSTIISVLAIGISFIALSFLTGNFFRQAAIDAQGATLSRILEVESRETLNTLQRHAINLGTALNKNNVLQSLLQRSESSERTEAILTTLDDPFKSGFVGASQAMLLKLRLYDLDFNPLYQSRQGEIAPPFTLPPHLMMVVSFRKGAERLKAIGSLWSSPQGPVYSVLLPIGGLRISGYIEAIFDPLYSLQTMRHFAHMPVSVHLPQAPPSPLQREDGGGNILPVEYFLYGDDGKVAYHLLGQQDITTLRYDMLHTQWLTIIGFLGLVFVLVLAALWLLHIGLFRPLRQLLQGIEAYGRGELNITIKPSGLAEIFSLGNHFNTMLERIRDDIRRLENYSTRDSLTGIANRRLFDSTLESTLCHAKRVQATLSLLYIDIDYFKRYNDSYGHPAGDRTLQQVAKTIAASARRDTDLVARIGGEEFAMLLPDTELGGAYQVAERLLQAIAEQEIEHHSSKIANHLTLSIGIASMLPGHDTQCHEYIEMADTALYQAKSEGRNRVIVAEGTRSDPLEV